MCRFSDVCALKKDSITYQNHKKIGIIRVFVSILKITKEFLEIQKIDRYMCICLCMYTKVCMYNAIIQHYLFNYLFKEIINNNIYLYEGEKRKGKKY